MTQAGSPAGGSMPVLQVVIASTRPGRVGLPVAEWFAAHAREHGAFDVEVVDLATVDLPNYDEPNHPRLRSYDEGRVRPNELARWEQALRGLRRPTTG